MIKKEDITVFEQRLDFIKTSWLYLDKYHNILRGKIEYTNADIDKLLAYYTERENYEVCKRLVKLKK